MFLWQWITGWFGPVSRVSLARVRNELEQLKSIRYDVCGCPPQSVLWHWLGGAIFALSWVAGERGAAPPSVPAHLERGKTTKGDGG